MTGAIDILIQNNRVQYKFTLKRNITILKGDSATGKTTLITLVNAYLQGGTNSGITLKCCKNCFVLNGPFWKRNLELIQNAIVFIDEGEPFIYGQEFAEAVKNGDNYFVIASREPLPMLPYSVEEVYGITNRTRGYGTVKRLYSSFERIYHQELPSRDILHVIVEDKNAGFDFFCHYFKSRNIDCQSAEGKNNIPAVLRQLPSEDYVLIIADGAAFGPEMETVLRMKISRHICLYLPESFEWIILRSGITDAENKVLDHPENYADSKTYFSWERFFTQYLSDITRNTYLEYTKKHLNSAYLSEQNQKKILEILPETLRKS